MPDNMESVFNNILTGASAETQQPAQDAEPRQAENGVQAQEQPAQPDTTQQYEQRLADLQRQLADSQKQAETTEKRRRDLESYYAKRENKLAERLERLERNYAPTDEYEGQQTQQKPQMSPEDLAELIQQEVSKALAGNEAIQKSTYIADINDWRVANPDAAPYELLIRDALEEFKWVPRNKEGLDAGLRFAKKIIQKAMEAERATKEAVQKVQQQQPQQQQIPQPQSYPGQQVTPEQAAALAAKARAYQPEEQMSASSNMKPKIPDNLPLEEQVRAMVKATMDQMG